MQLTRPSVLMVSPTYSHPSDQGNSARIQAFGRALKARGIEVDFLHYVLDWAGETSDRAMRECWRNFFQLNAFEKEPQAFPACWGLDDWCPAELTEKVQSLQGQYDYDAVVVNYVWLSAALEGAGSALKILDTHDMFGDRHRVASKAGIHPNWYFTTIEEESRGFDRADIVIAIQADELEVVKSRTRSEALLVSHPVQPVATSPYLTSVRKLADFGYLASGNPWNQMSVVELDAEMEKLKLDWLLGGRICSVDMKLSSRPFELGEIELVGEFYAAVRCCLNPMVEATGLKIKTIEALSFDVPVIGTNAAFAGLQAEHAFHKCATVSDVGQAAAEFVRHNSLEAELRLAGRQLFFKYLERVQGQFDVLANKIRAGRKNKVELLS